MANEIDRLMLIDCKRVQSMSDITRELNTVLGTDISFEKRLIYYSEMWLKLIFEQIEGKTWLVLDNDAGKLAAFVVASHLERRPKRQPKPTPPPTT